MPQGSSEHSHSLNSFDTNSPSAGFSQEAFVEQPIQKSRLEKIESEGNFVITNALPSSEQPPFSELLFENHMTNEESGSHFIDKSQFLNAVEEIHFVPLGSDVPLSVPPPRKLRLHDELQQAEVFAGPSNQKNGKQTPIITAIPSVVASSHKVMQRKQFANDQTSTQAQDSNTLTYPSEIFTTDEPSFSSGSFDEQTAFSDRLTQTTAHRQKRHLEQFLKEAQRSFNAGHPDATSTSWQASPSTPVPTSQPHQPSVYHASKLGIPLRREEPSPRLARQDSLVESQQAPPLVGTDGNREIRMPRTKPPSDQRPTAWIKPGYATASFSAVNQEKPPLIHRSVSTL